MTTRARERWPRVAPWLVAVCLLPAPGWEGPREGTAWDLPPGADHATLERLYRETGAARDLPGPDWGDYVETVQSRFGAWLTRRVPALGPSGEILVRAAAWTVFALLSATLGLLLWRWGREFLGRRPPARARSVPVRPAPGPAAAGGKVDWRARIDESLARGRVEEAFEAIWWWLATSLLGAGAEASWTSRELLAGAGRGDLRPSALTLDRMMYGPVRPSPDEVRAFVVRLEGLLA